MALLLHSEYSPNINAQQRNKKRAIKKRSIFTASTIKIIYISFPDVFQGMYTVAFLYNLNDF